MALLFLHFRTNCLLVTPSPWSTKGHCICQHHLRSVHKVPTNSILSLDKIQTFLREEKLLGKAILFHKATEVTPHRAWAFSHEQCLAMEEDYTEERNREAHYKRRRLKVSESLLPVRQGWGRKKKREWRTHRLKGGREGVRKEGGRREGGREGGWQAGQISQLWNYNNLF